MHMFSGRRLPLRFFPVLLGPLVALAFFLPPAAADETAEDREATLLFNTASRFYRQKNWEDAAATFGELLTKFPGHRDAAEARFARGYCLNRVGKHAAAVEVLRLAVRDEGTPWAADSNFYLGRSLEALAQEAKSDSEERTRRLLAAAESYGRAAELYARDEKSPPPAGSAGAEGPPPAEKARDFRVLSLGAQGEALYQAGKAQEAVAALEPLIAGGGESLQGSPYFQRGVYVLGLARHALAKKLGSSFEGARVALALAALPRFDKEPLWEEAAYLLARLLHQENNLEGAVEAYGPVVRKGGGRAPEAAYYRALALYEEQKPETLGKAREELGRFLREHSSHALAGRARFYEALCAFDLKDHTAASAAFQTVATESPDLAGRALLRRGQALLLRSEPDAAGATEALTRAVSLLEGEGAGGAAADPAALERAAEARYWLGEALSAQGSRLVEAAQAYGEVFQRYAAAAPELAEKGLYQKARSLYLAKRPVEAAAACELYRKTYPAERATFWAETTLLAAECAFHAEAGAIPEAARREAPPLYLEAGKTLKNPAEARRARYMAGVSLYFLGQHRQAAQQLEEVAREVAQDAQAAQQLPELSFYLADALAQEPRKETATEEDRARWKKAAALYSEYLDRSKDGTHLPNALINLGLCQEWLGDQEAARKAFDRFLTQFPAHELAGQVRFELGNTRLAAGDLEGAAKAYAAAAEAGSGAAPMIAARALFQKAMLERRLNKPAEAAQTLAGLLAAPAEAVKSDAEGQRMLRDAAYQRSVALLEAGKGDEARAGLEAFLGQNSGSPQEAEARNQLARSLLDAGKPAEALKPLEPLLTAGASQVGRDQALYLAAWCHSALAASADGATQAREREEMEASYRRLIAEHPQSVLAVDSMLELGQNLFNRKAYAEAKKWLEQVREALETATVPPPTDSPARARDLAERSAFGLGFIAFEEGDFPLAAKLFDRVLENPQGALAPRAAFQAGRAFMRSSNFAEAAVRFERVTGELAARAGDLVEEALLRLGESYHQLMKYPEALKALDRQLREFPDGELRHEARFGRGFALQFSGDFDGAAEAYRSVATASRQPVAARAQYHIGECRVEQGRHRDAAKEFNTTVANFDLEGPYREWVRRSLLGAGLAFQQVGDNKAAAAQFRELVERFGDSEEGRAAQERLKALGGK